MRQPVPLWSAVLALILGIGIGLVVPKSADQSTGQVDRVFEVRLVHNPSINSPAHLLLVDRRIRECRFRSAASVDRFAVALETFLATECGRVTD